MPITSSFPGGKDTFPTRAALISTDPIKGNPPDDILGNSSQDLPGWMQWIGDTLRKIEDRIGTTGDTTVGTDYKRLTDNESSAAVNGAFISAIFAQKGAPNGFASLGAGGQVIITQLATGTPGTGKYLDSTGAWSVPGGAGSLSTFDLANWSAVPFAPGDYPSWDPSTNKFEPTPVAAISGDTVFPKGHKIFIANTAGPPVVPDLWTAAGQGDIIGPTTPIININSTTIKECSGLGISAQHPDRAFGLNDSGDLYNNVAPGGGAGPPWVCRIYGINLLTGARTKDFRMRAPSAGSYFTNIDMEELSSVLIGGVHYLFAYDTNNASPGGTPGGGISKMYRMVEPDPDAGADGQDITANLINISWTGINGGAGYYSEGSFIDPLDGFGYIFQTGTNSSGGLCRVFKTSASLVSAVHNSTVTLTQIATFSVAPKGTGGATSEWVGACDIARDRTVILVHTYSNNNGAIYDKIMIFPIAVPASTTIAAAIGAGYRLATDDGTGQDKTSENQGEGTGMTPDSRGYIRVSEGTNRPLRKFVATPAGSGGGASDYPITLDDEDFIILVQASAGNDGSVSLPSPATGPKRVGVKRTDNLSEQQFVVTGAEMFNGDTDDKPLMPGSSMIIYNTGSSYESI